MLFAALSAAVAFAAPLRPAAPLLPPRAAHPVLRAAAGDVLPNELTSMLGVSERQAAIFVGGFPEVEGAPFAPTGTTCVAVVAPGAAEAPAGSVGTTMQTAPTSLLGMLVESSLAPLYDEPACFVIDVSGTVRKVCAADAPSVRSAIEGMQAEAPTAAEAATLARISSEDAEADAAAAEKRERERSEAEIEELLQQRVYARIGEPPTILRGVNKLRWKEKYASAYEEERTALLGAELAASPQLGQGQLIARVIFGSAVLAVAAQFVQ